MIQCKRAPPSPSPLGLSLFCIKTFACLRTSGLHLASTSPPTVWFISECSSVEKWADARRLVRANSWTCRVFVCACSVFAVGAPVVREEADFGLPSGEDSLQAGFLRRLAHVLHHPVQQLQGRQTRWKREHTVSVVVGFQVIRVISVFFYIAICFHQYITMDFERCTDANDWRVFQGTLSSFCQLHPYHRIEGSMHLLKNKRLVLAM